MYKQKIGISISNNYVRPINEVIEIIKNVGFDAISPVWEKGVSLEEIVKFAQSKGLEIQSLHAPYCQSAGMWSKDKNESEKSLNELYEALADAHYNKIPVVVMHTWIGFDNIPSPTDEGIKNFEKIVSKAKEYGIKIAFENTEGLEHLEALMEHFENDDTVGFCWDSGHEMCYNHSKDLLAKYGNRLIMTHLNDNLGISRFDGTTYWTDDLHLLPFDGVADWSYNVQRLKSSKHLEILNFELNIHSKPNRHENDKYGKMTLEEYFTEAYARACKIAYNVSK